MYSYKPELFIILEFPWAMQQYTTYILFSDSLDAYYIGFTGDAINTRLAKHLSDHKGFTSRAKIGKLLIQKYIAANLRLCKEKSN